MCTPHTHKHTDGMQMFRIVPSNSPQGLFTICGACVTCCADPPDCCGRQTSSFACFLRLAEGAAAACNSVRVASDETEIGWTRKRSIDGKELLQWWNAV